MECVLLRVVWMTRVQRQHYQFYHTRPITSQYNEMTLLHFAQNYTMSQTDSEPKHRTKLLLLS